MQATAHDEPVYLGFGTEIAAEDLFRLRSHYLPLGKIGGKPSWLNPKNLPKTEDLECKVCKKSMCFMMQVYATSNDDPIHSFHRSLFFFLCRNPECSKQDDPSNMAVFRCGLPRKTPYYSSDGPLDPDMDGDVPDPRYPQDAPHLCTVCGCYASKKCSKCGNAWYCCRDHQALDWTTVHKARCGQTPPDPCDGDESLTMPKNPPNIFLFKEMGIEMDQEYVTGNVFEDSDDEDENGTGDTEDEERRRIAEFKNMVEEKKIETTGDALDEEDGGEGEEQDPIFKKFHRLISLSPDQIMRYQRGGKPLPATSKAQPLPSPDACHICGGERHFEMQLTPHLLSLLGVDTLGKSIDWASVYVYTCKDNCQIPDDSYAKEFLAKQDFVE